MYSRLGTEGPRPSDRFFHMDGRRVYRFVRRTVTQPGFLEVLHRAGLVDEAELAQLTAGDRSDADGPPEKVFARLHPVLPEALR